MEYGFVYVLGFGFWTLAAIAVVCLLSWCYIQAQYYHWDKVDRHESIVKTVVDRVKAELDRVKDELEKDE